MILSRRAYKPNTMHLPVRQQNPGLKLPLRPVLALQHGNLVSMFQKAPSTV